MVIKRQRNTVTDNTIIPRIMLSDCKIVSPDATEESEESEMAVTP